MGVDRKRTKASNRIRPKKGPGDRRRRERVQAERLIALGADAVAVSKMNPKEVRTLLKRPLRVVADSL